MPLHDFECKNCSSIFEELHNANEKVACPHCGGTVKQLVSPLADYTGQNSLTVQYVTRKSTVKDSHITKIPTEKTFLRNSIPTRKAN